MLYATHSSTQIFVFFPSTPTHFSFHHPYHQSPVIHYSISRFRTTSKHATLRGPTTSPSPFRFERHYWYHLSASLRPNFSNILPRELSIIFSALAHHVSPIWSTVGTTNPSNTFCFHYHPAEQLGQLSPHKPIFFHSTCHTAHYSSHPPFKVRFPISSHKSSPLIMRTQVL